MGVGGGGGWGGTARPSGPYAYAVFIWSSQSDNRYDRDDYMATWLYIRKMETARHDYMQTRFNAGYLTSGTTGDFID